MTRAAIYTRLSIDRDGRGVAVERQREDCLRIAEQRGWQVVAEYVDNSKSAWRKGVRRPGWEAMLDAVGRGDLDALVVWHGDRLIRQPRDLERLIDLADQGLLIASVAGERDLSKPDDRFVLRVEVAAQCRESDSTSRRVCRALEQRAEQGSWPAGRVPFGWRTEDEAVVVQGIVRGILEGRSVRSLAMDLDRNGVPAPQGGTWNRSTIVKIARRPANAGLRLHRGVVVGKGSWPALVSEDEHEAVVRALTPGTPRPGGNARRWLLSGLLECGKCGTSMTHAPARGGSYRCVPTAHITVKDAAIEEYVLDVIQARLDRPDAVAAANDGRVSGVAALRARLDRLRSSRDALGEDFAEGLISREVLRSGSARVEASIAEVEAELAVLESGQGAVEDLPAVIRDAPLDRQRAVIDALATFTVQPLPAGVGPRWAQIEDRVTVSWRS